MAQVECPQCGTKYRILFPDGSVLVSALDSTELLIHRVCPIVAGGVCVGSLYWTCVTFGAVTLMQTLGQNRCLILMERAGRISITVNTRVNDLNPSHIIKSCRLSTIAIVISDPLFLLVSLPLIPVGLVLGKMVRWEEPVSFIKEH